MAKKKKLGQSIFQNYSPFGVLMVCSDQNWTKVVKGGKNSKNQLQTPNPKTLKYSVKKKLMKVFSNYLNAALN